MSFDTLSSLVLSLAVIVFGGGSVVRYALERRTSKAQGTVASATVELQVDAARLQNLEHRFGLAQRAWDAERASLLSRIGNLEGALEEERTESEKKNAKIAELQERLALVLEEVQSLTKELSDLRETQNPDI